MDITGNTLVGDIATLVPASIGVFERYGVDIYSKGDLSLEEAIREAGLSVGDILAEIERALEAVEEEDRLHAELASSAPQTLADHVREVHHGYLTEHLPRVGRELVPALLAWGDTCDPLFEIARRFEQLRNGLLSHLADEEHEVFPLVGALSAEAAGEPTHVERAALTEALARADLEHRAALEALEDIRSLIEDCVCDDGEPPRCTDLFQQLRALEADIRRHIHLEDDVLFPAIRRLAGV